MTKDRRTELIDKIKELDTNDFSINMTKHGDLHVYLGNLFTKTLLDPNNEYIDRIIDLAKEFDVKDYVDNDSIEKVDLYDLLEEMNVYDIFEDVDIDIIPMFENKLKEYLAINEDEFNEFYDSLFNPVNDNIGIGEVETYPQHLNDIIISNIPEINEVLKNIDKAIQEHEASSKTNSIML